jgi:hypothetical protein
LKGPLPPAEFIVVPVGRFSTTIVTNEFAEDFRAALMAEVADPKSRQGFEQLRQRVLLMSFAELVGFNRYRNLVGDSALEPLYEREISRAHSGIPQTESYQQGGVTLSFTEQFVKELREAVIVAVDQKEKDFVNEHAS